MAGVDGADGFRLEVVPVEQSVQRCRVQVGLEGVGVRLPEPRLHLRCRQDLLPRRHVAGLGGLGQPPFGLVAVGIAKDKAEGIGRASAAPVGGVAEQTDAVIGAIVAVRTDDSEPKFGIC